MQLQSILPPRFRRWIRSGQISRNFEQAYEQRWQVAERLITDIRLTQPNRNAIRHILFIVIDCLRRDHLSLYGYTRKTTPFLESLGESSAVFRDAISASSWTYASVISILTALYPHHHGGVFADDLRGLNKGMLPLKVKKQILFLPEILNHFGFTTYVGSSLGPVDLPLIGRFQLASIYHRENANYALRRYVRWLRSNQTKRTFAYLQLGDLHTRISVPARYRSAFGKIPNIPRLGRWDYQEGAMTGDLGFERYRENRIKLYDAALLYVDAQLRKLFHRLEALNLKDKTLVVITADHGEEMWDHWQFEKDHFFDPRQKYGVGHGHHLWQEIVGVPLLLWGPEISAQEVQQRVTLVDVVPTVLQLCGIKGWGALQLDGQNLLDSLNERVIFAEDVCFGYEKKAVFEKKYKLYYSKGDDIRWIFDLENDPYEQTPLNLPKVANRLIRFIPEAVDNKAEERLSVDDETRRRLRDLGYIE